MVATQCRDLHSQDAEMVWSVMWETVTPDELSDLEKNGELVKDKASRIRAVKLVPDSEPDNRRISESRRSGEDDEAGGS